MSHCNILKSSNLDNVLRIALEAPKDNDDSILIETKDLLKNSRKFRYLYSRPKLYLNDTHQTSQE
jgi:hypothetical protein